MPCRRDLSTRPAFELMECGWCRKASTLYYISSHPNPRVELYNGTICALARTVDILILYGRPCICTKWDWPSNLPAGLSAFSWDWCTN